MTGSSAAPGTPAERLLSSLQGLAATLTAIVQTRLALLATEVEEEKTRLLAVLGWGAVAILMGSVASVFAAAFVAVLLWDSHPLLALGGLTLLFAAVCALAWARVARVMQSSAGLLGDTLAELQADHEALLAAARASAGEVQPGAGAGHSSAVKAAP